MDSLQFFQAMSMVLSDRPKMAVDAVILHSRSFGGTHKLFELAAELSRLVPGRLVAINGATCLWGYTQKLQALGCQVVTSYPAPFNLEEVIAFSRLAEERSWSRVVVVAEPSQLLLAMQVHVKVMEKRNYPMQVYAAAPVSQIEDEFKYFNKGENDPEWKKGAEGNLATVSEVIEYVLRKRSTLVCSYV